ncbi:MAG: TolB family protein [Candidatus Limnocylindria bacterium]
MDLTGRRAPLVAAEWEPKMLVFRPVSASRDGRVVALSAPSARSASALYVLRTETGRLDVIFDEPQILAVEPQISPDGTKVAFTQLRVSGTSGADLGIWLHDRTNGSMRSIAEPQAVSGAFAAGLGWSSDGASLAIKRSFAQPSVRLVPTVGGSEIPVADGHRVSWRARAPELLIGATMLGGQVVRIQTYDMATKTVREVHRVERSILRDLQWHPTAGRFIYGQNEPGIIGRSPEFELWQRNADGSQATLIERSTRGQMFPEWSPDGSLLTGFQADSSTTIGLIEMPSGRRIATLCRQGGTPPDRCT